MPTMKSQERGVVVVTLRCKDNRMNEVRLVRDPRGEIYMEVMQKHGGDTAVAALLRLGRMWELLPRLAALT